MRRIVALVLLAVLALQAPQPAEAAGFSFNGAKWGCRVGRALLELIGAREAAQCWRKEEQKKAKAKAPPKKAGQQTGRGTAKQPQPASTGPTTAGKESADTATPATTPVRRPGPRSQNQPPVVHLQPTLAPWQVLLPTLPVVGELLRLLWLRPVPSPVL